MTTARILIVEDDRIIASAISALLHDFGYEISASVSTGEDAIAKASEHRPDLVLSDIVLEGEIDGIEASGRIWEQFRIPTVYLTAYADDENLERAKRTEPLGYLVKPFEEAELRSTIEMALYKHKMESRLRESEERFRLLYENIPVGYQSLDEAGRIIEVNEAWLDFFVCTRKTALNRPFREFVAEEEQSLFDEAFARFKADGDIDGTVFTVLRGDGAIAAARLEGNAARDEDGRFTRGHFIVHDVTEQRRVQQAILRAKTEWERTFDSIADPIAIIDKDFRIVRANRALTATFGLEFSTALGARCHEIFHCDESPHPLCPHRRSLADGKEHWAEIYEKRLDRTFLVTTSPIKDQSGEIPGCAHVAKDITERKRAEEEVRGTKELLEAAFNATNDFACLLDAEGAFLAVNQSLAERFGARPDEIVGRKADEFLDPDVAAGRRAHLRNVVETRSPVTFEDEHRGLVLSTNLYPVLGLDGEVEMIVVFSRDITEQRRAEEELRLSEERYRQLIDLSPSGVLVHSEGEIIFANDGAASILGLGDADDLIGAQLIDFIHPDYRDLIRTRIATMRKTGAASRVMEQRCLRGDGSIVDVDAVGTPIRFQGRTAILSVIHDITDRKKAQALLHVQRDLAVALGGKRRLEDALSLVLASAIQVAEMDCGGVYLIDRRSGEMRLASHQGIPPDFVELVRAFPRDSIQGRLSARGIPVYTHSRDLESPMDEISARQNLRGVAVVPVQDQEEVSACLVVGSRSTDEVSETARNALEAIASEIGSAVARLRAEEAQRESENRLRAILEIANDCFYMKSRELRYTHVNPAMAKLFEMSASEMIGKTDEELFGRQVAEHVEETDRRVLSGDSVEQELTRVVNGVPLTFLETKVPVRASSGEIIGIGGISRNITARIQRKRAQPSPKIRYPSEAYGRTVETAMKAAATDGTVLLLGESGSGKDHLARVIHDHSRRSAGPFFTINCATVPHELAESELFGHERGAFTGAQHRAQGLLELAEGGTLLLNEIGELSPALQAKLLTFLDHKTFTRVGGREPIRVNARLIAATNRDLAADVDAGTFRSDLYYRLNVLSIRVPPLRERRDDIPFLVRELLAALSSEMQLHEAPELDPATIEKLRQYAWPGNIRELRNVLERGLILSGDTRLEDRHFEPDQPAEDNRTFRVDFPDGRSLDMVVDEIAAHLIDEALRRTAGNKVAAARILGISRHALRRRMISLGMAG